MAMMRSMTVLPPGLAANQDSVGVGVGEEDGPGNPTPPDAYVPM